MVESCTAAFSLLEPVLWLDTTLKSVCWGHSGATKQYELVGKELRPRIPLPARQKGGFPAGRQQLCGSKLGSRGLGREFQQQRTVGTKLQRPAGRVPFGNEGKFGTTEKEQVGKRGELRLLRSAGFV